MNTQSGHLFTSESVTAGHPDKVCDQISDAVLDEALRLDPNARVAVEALATRDRVVLAGEVTCAGTPDYPQIVRRTLHRIGYTDPALGFAAETVDVDVQVGEQSADIAQSVETSLEAREGGVQDALSQQGAGDQGIMFGYACADTPALMPVPIALAHRLAHELEAARAQVPQLRPDGKTQVSVQFEGGNPVALDTVVVSTQHDESMSLTQVRDAVRTLVVDPIVRRCSNLLDVSGTRLLINPSGRFVAGGPAADTGLTGRKIIVDTYGGFARHGGGAFSGKDASKVDRSASYAMRWIAKTVVAAGLAKRCELQVSYAIGRAEPVGLWIDTFGTAAVPEAKITAAILEVFDLRPAAITTALALSKPVFAPTAAYGHFGRDGFSWETTERADALREAIR